MIIFETQKSWRRGRWRGWRWRTPDFILLSSLLSAPGSSSNQTAITTVVAQVVSWIVLLIFRVMVPTFPFFITDTDRCVINWVWVTVSTFVTLQVLLLNVLWSRRRDIRVFLGFLRRSKRNPSMTSWLGLSPSGEITTYFLSTWIKSEGNRWRRGSWSRQSLISIGIKDPSFSFQMIKEIQRRVLINRRFDGSSIWINRWIETGSRCWSILPEDHCLTRRWWRINVVHTLLVVIVTREDGTWHSLVLVLASERDDRSWNTVDKIRSICTDNRWRCNEGSFSQSKFQFFIS